jgi:predicted RNase H-like nuclease (RuvC/YqgF family)
MDEATILKTALDIGISALIVFVVWQCLGVLRLAITSQASAFDTLRRWFESELTQRDAKIMALEKRFDDQCEETERLKLRIAELESQITEKVAEIERLKEAIKQLKSNDEKKDERIKEQNDRIRDLERELKQVKDQRDELVKRLDDLLSTKEKGNGGDKKVSKIADHIDERPPITDEKHEEK